MDVPAAYRGQARQATVYIITMGAISIMGKERYNVTRTLSADGGLVIMEEAQSFGSPSDPLVLKVFDKTFHILLTGDAAQVMGGTSPGCAEVWNFRSYRPSGMRIQLLQELARSLHDRLLHEVWRLNWEVIFLQ